MSVLAKWGGFSFLWTSFKWFFSSLDGKGCSGGFDHFPSFGLQALKWQFNFDFQQTYVGVGMICPHAVNISMLLGAIFSWGFLWPLIASKARALPYPGITTFFLSIIFFFLFKRPCCWELSYRGASSGLPSPVRHSPRRLPGSQHSAF